MNATRPLLNSIEDAAARLGLGRSKVYQLMDSGQLENVKVGDRRLIPEEGLNDLVARLRAGEVIG